MLIPRDPKMPPLGEVTKHLKVRGLSGIATVTDERPWVALVGEAWLCPWHSWAQLLALWLALSGDTEQKAFSSLC